MEYKTLSKVMGAMLFISCMGSAFALYNMAVVFATGELPYGLKPLLPKEKDPAKVTEAEKVANETEKKILDKKKNEEVGDGYMNRINEKMVRELYRRLQQMEEKISLEKENVASEKKSAEETQLQASKMQKELENYRDKISNLLDQMDKQEITNIKKIVFMIESMSLDAAIALFKTYNKDKAARILYYMNPKFSKDMVQTMLENAKTQSEKDDIRDITERMQYLMEEIK